MSTINLATLLVLLKLDQKQFDSGVEGSKKKTLDLKDAIGGGLVVAIGLATKAALTFARESLAEFQTFEKGLREVYTLLPGVSEDAMEKMQDDVLAFSRETGRLTDEVVPALYQSLSAGQSQDSVMEFMAVASDAALGGVAELSQAVDVLSGSVNTYGEESLTAQEASDVLFTAVRLGKTTFAELSASISNVLPTAQSLGVSFQDVIADITVLTTKNVSTAQATTQLRQAFIEASKSGTGLSDAIKELTGQSFAELIDEGRSSSEIFQTLRESMPEQEFRDLFSSVEAANAVLLLTGDNAEQAEETLRAMGEAAGATAAAADTMAQSIEYLQDKSNTSTEALKIQAGEALEPLQRAYYETVIAASELASESLSLRDQVIDSSHALEEFGYEGVALQKALGAIGEGTVLWRESLVDADAMARRTAIAVELLEDGFQGSADELGKQVIAIEEARQASLELGEAYESSDQVLANHVRTMEAAQEAAEAARQAAIDQADAERELAHQSEYLTSQSDQLNEQMERTAEVSANAEERLAYVAEQEEMAAEAAKEAEEATRALNRESGSLFSTLSESEGPLGIYYQSLEDIANGASNLVVNQDSLDSAMIRAAENAGASASAMALLKVATGELSAEQAEAVIKQVALEQTLARLAEQYATGDATLGEYMSAAQEAIREINNMTVEFDTATGAVNTSNQAIGTLIGTMGQIPSEIRTHISITSDPMPNMPTVGGGSGGSLPGAAGDAGVQTHARGGFTGWGAENEIAGMVHGQEFVFSAPAVRSIGLPMLEMLHQQGMAAGGNSGVSIGDVYVTPGAADSPIEYGRAVRRDLLTVARGKGLRR